MTPRLPQAEPAGASPESTRRVLPFDCGERQGHDVIGEGIQASTGLIEMEIVGDSGRAEPVTFRLRLDVFEVYVSERNRAAFDRDRLAAWMLEPIGRIEADDVVFTTDSHRRIVFALPNCAGWVLPPAVAQLLRDQL